jgi:ssDNA-binding Zn-finger/Zn-ribbon topoisomerase 1
MPRTKFVKKEEDWNDIASRLKAIIEAITIIQKLKENQGIIKCPVCKGDLHYSRAKVNGHIWGSCKTPGCISWKQ